MIVFFFVKSNFMYEYTCSHILKFYVHFCKYVYEYEIYVYIYVDLRHQKLRKYQFRRSSLANTKMDLHPATICDGPLKSAEIDVVLCQNFCLGGECMLNSQRRPPSETNTCTIQNSSI